MPDAGTLEREWAEIRASGKGDGVLEVPSRLTGVSSGYGEVRIAIGPRGEPRLLVPIGRPAGRAASAGNRNLLLTGSSFLSAGKLEHFIDISLRDQRLGRVFTELAGEILKRLERGDPPDAAVHGTIQDFRSLLAQSQDGDIALSSVAGLIGELVVLKRLTAQRPAALEGWTGPMGQRHDFRRMDVAIEVKTSLRSDASRVSIHGPEQLQAPNGGRLHLAHVRIEQADSGKLSVMALCQSIIAHGADQFRLEERLNAMGCPSPNDEAWNALSFSLEGFDLYAVIDGFPRITPDTFPGSALPLGILTLDYDIDLAMASSCRLTAKEAECLFSEFAA